MHKTKHVLKGTEKAVIVVKNCYPPGIIFRRMNTEDTLTLDSQHILFALYFNVHPI